jgi:hypothetical protein
MSGSKSVTQCSASNGTFPDSIVGTSPNHWLFEVYEEVLEGLFHLEEVLVLF